jgi:hypothetical protein
MKTASSVFDPDKGMLNGLNCAIMGDDVNLILDTFCTQLFNTIFSLRLCLGIAAFGILFAMCCSTCSGIRHFHQLTSSTDIIPIENEKTKMDIKQKDFSLYELQ